MMIQGEMIMANNDFVIENGVLVKYTGEGGDVVVPDGVIEIGERAFCKTEIIHGYTVVSESKSIHTVMLPNGITTIGKEAFSMCIALKTVRLPNTLISIDKSAFWRCGLEELVIPASVKTIGEDAFRNTILKKITLLGKPKIGKNAFLCFQNYNHDGWNNLMSNNFTPEIQAHDSVTVLPYALDWESVSAEFYHKLLKQQLVLRDADLKYYLKRLMSSLKGFSLQVFADFTADELYLLEKHGFITAKNEESLLEIVNNIECRTELLKYINENITSEQRDSNEQEAFERDVKKIVARGALLDNALNEFSSRKPAKVKKEWITSEIDGGLRIDKYNGTDVVIVIPSVIDEKTVIEIAADAMRASTSAEDGRKSAYNKKMYKNKAIIILDGITVIGENAFSGCVYMTDICLPESVTLIAKNAFEACHKLTIHAPATSYAEQYALEHNIPFIAE